MSLFNFDAYDVRAPSNNPVPPKNYMAYLQDQTIVKKIGAQGSYQECNAGIYSLFQATGDSMPIPDFPPCLYARSINWR